LNSVFTGKKLFIVALFVTIILFIAVCESQLGSASTPILSIASSSSSALPSLNNRPARPQIRVASFSLHRANCHLSVLPVTDQSVLPSPLPVATQSATATPDPNLPSLRSFIAQVTNGDSAALVGIYVKDIVALQIVQQPDGDPAYIDLTEGTATQFYKASLFGSIGLLAHNYLSGRYFFAITSGADLILVYGDGKTSHYTVSEIGDYQRLSLTDLRSDFMDLATNEKKSVDEVFAHYYQQEGVLTLQTCITQNGISDWGVRFILARPLQALQDPVKVVSKSR
jgi:hypothetical protein